MSVEALNLLQLTLSQFIETATAQPREMVALTKANSGQTDKVVALTEQLPRLTAVITWLTVGAAVFGGVQALAVLVHFYRWYRGWL